MYGRDVITSTVDFMPATATGDEMRRFQLRAGDVVITKDSESWNDIAVPAHVAERLDDVLCGYHLALVRPSSAEAAGKYLFYAFQARGIAERFHVEAVGITRFALSRGAICDVRLPVPPLSVQRAIAAFLDRKTAAIDGLIAKKERLLELLEENRTALITQAVTKGITPAVAMKESGVGWLGEVPAHWQLSRLRFLTAGPLAYGASEAAEFSNPDWPRFVRITDLRDDGSLRDDTFKSLPEEMAEPYLLREGDLLFARSGATVGKSFRYDASWGRAAFAGYLVRARVDERRGLSRFIWFFAQSMPYWGWVAANSIQATIQNVSAERYSNLLIALPPLEEQKRILQFVEEGEKRLSCLAARVVRAIALLREYRTALITAAVTGQIEVPAETGAEAT